MNKQIEIKMAKASKEDIQRCIKFFQFVEEFMDYGTHTPENQEFEEDSIDLTNDDFVERLRELWGRRFGPPGVDCSWSRVVNGCDVLIDNVCDPNSDVLEWKTEIAERLNGTSTVASELPTWRCFHCSFETSDESEAKSHFGDDSGDPALCIFWASMDDHARAHEYQQMVLELDATRQEVCSLNAAIDDESAEGMRMFRELETRVQLEIQRAEENGYSRGLHDAQKHPEEIGLCRMSESLVQIDRPS